MTTAPDKFLNAALELRNNPDGVEAAFMGRQLVQWNCRDKLPKSERSPGGKSGMKIHLVHGAWHGRWCWAKRTGKLEEHGHTVVARDLPGLGDDRTPAAEITLENTPTRFATH